MASKRKISSKKRAAQGRQKGSLWGKATGFILIAGCMFFLGVLVGRGTAPVRFDVGKLERKLAALQATAVEQRKGAAANEDMGSNAADLDFYEALKTPGTTARLDDANIAAPAIITEKAPMTVSKNVPEKKKKKVPISKQKPIRPKASSADLAQKSVKSVKSVKPVKSAAQKGRFTIQVSAIKSQKTAAVLVSKLKALGFSAYIAKGYSPQKGTWFRVRVGHQLPKGDALTMMKRLKKANFKTIYMLKTERPG